MNRLRLSTIAKCFHKLDGESPTFVRYEKAIRNMVQRSLQLEPFKIGRVYTYTKHDATLIRFCQILLRSGLSAEVLEIFEDWFVGEKISQLLWSNPFTSEHEILIDFFSTSVVKIELVTSLEVTEASTEYLAPECTVKLNSSDAMRQLRTIFPTY